MRWRIDLPGSLFRPQRNRDGLTSQQEDILRALVNGYHLKAHRYLSGTKEHLLHDAEGHALRTVPAHDVERLEALGYIAANMKFPAAVYMLTESGDRRARALSSSVGAPILARVPDHDPAHND